MYNGQITFPTERLNLIPVNLQLINAELKSPSLLASMLNAEVSPEWPPGDYDENAQLYFQDQLQKFGSQLDGWLNWYAVTKTTGSTKPALIAAGGFMGAPSENGEVEIGYSVIESYRHNGYAAEIVHALIDIARNDGRVKYITARTTDNNSASQAVLEKLKFVNTGTKDSDGNRIYKLIL
jgi:RimJ/RimL family protein N-acetyltransferase